MTKSDDIRAAALTVLARIAPDGCTAHVQQMLRHDAASAHQTTRAERGAARAAEPEWETVPDDPSLGVVRPWPPLQLATIKG